MEASSYLEQTDEHRAWPTQHDPHPGDRDAMTALAPAAAQAIRRLELAADTLTPVTAALRLGDRCPFLLESVEGGVRYARYSIVGIRGRALSVRGEVARLSDGQVFGASDPLEALRRVLPTGASQPGDPAALLVCGVGYLAYEAAARWERVPVPAADPFGLPDAMFHLPSSVVVFDHLAQVVSIATLDGPGADERLMAIAATLAVPAADEGPAQIDDGRVAFEDSPERRIAFEASVATVVAEIHAGEMLQAVIARRFDVPARHDAMTTYRRLRRINPSPYLYYLDLAPAMPGAAMVGASPELLVRVRGDEIVTRPIAGTRPRDHDPIRDAALEADLRNDPKELAEHAMLVDLARNDVGRVAAPNSVEVTELRGVERYAHVMHLVSEVRGQLAEGRDAFDAVRAVFPAGTVSGAPKVRAMQAIADRERERRGPYGGAIGYFSPTDTEIAITIRSAVMLQGRAVVHAGAGIVADSVPEREAAEVAAKAASMLAALGAELAP